MIDITKSLKGNTEITLLSIEEYESIKEHIPYLNCWWWLRSPGGSQSRAASVDGDGLVNYDGDYVDEGDDCVRPALKYKILNPIIGMVFSAFGNRWTVCGKGIAISNGAIDFRRFDAKSNEYETSEIKKFLEEWIKK